MKVIRNCSNGRILGGLDYFWNDEDDFWEDEKVKSKDVRFPIHDDYQSSPVKIYHISELNKNN